MPSKKSRSTKRRTQVKDLPKKKKGLGEEELKKVKGGVTASYTELSRRATSDTWHPSQV